MIYFDNNATTPIDERVFDAMLPFLKTMYGNPSSVHRLGRIAKSAVETAREQVAALVDAEASQVIFTSGGTEANNLAINSAFGQLAISAVEHSSIFEPAKRFDFDCAYKIKLRSTGYRLVYEVDEGEIIVFVIAVGKRENNVVYDVAAQRKS